MEGGKEAHGERDQNELQKSEAVLQYETGVPEERETERSIVTQHLLFGAKYGVYL